MGTIVMTTDGIEATGIEAVTALVIEVAIAVSKKITIGAEIGAGIEAGILIRKEAIMIQTEIVKEIVRLQAATAYTVTITKLKPQRRFNSFLVRKRLKNQCKLQGQHQIQIKRLTFLDLLVLGNQNRQETMTSFHFDQSLNRFFSDLFTTSFPLIFANTFFVSF